ncbi:hypothetical protein D3C86_1456690 [compost metagenome]
MKKHPLAVDCYIMKAIAIHVEHIGHGHDCVSYLLADGWIVPTLYSHNQGLGSFNFLPLIINTRNNVKFTSVVCGVLTLGVWTRIAWYKQAAWFYGPGEFKIFHFLSIGVEIFHRPSCGHISES